MKMHLCAGALLGATALILASYFQHEMVLDAHDQQRIATAIRYQQLHAVMLVIVGLTPFLKLPNNLYKYFKWSGNLWLMGSLIFSSSLYFGVLTHTDWMFRFTPTGGMLLIIGWLILAYAALISNEHTV